RAVEMSVFVVRAFVKYRELLARNEAFGNRLAELESKVAGHDDSIREIVAALRQLYQDGAEGEARPIGFRVDSE
ncbi:MAG: ORF6N domain-containing protein, partial [bacterium]